MLLRMVAQPHRQQNAAHSPNSRKGPRGELPPDSSFPAARLGSLRAIPLADEIRWICGGLERERIRVGFVTSRQNDGKQFPQGRPTTAASQRTQSCGAPATLRCPTFSLYEDAARATETRSEASWEPERRRVVLLGIARPSGRCHWGKSPARAARLRDFSAGHA